MKDDKEEYSSATIVTPVRPNTRPKAVIDSPTSNRQRKVEQQGEGATIVRKARRKKIKVLGFLGVFFDQKKISKTNNFFKNKITPKNLFPLIKVSSMKVIGMV